MTDIDITLEEGESKGRYFYRADSGEEAEITFSRVNPNRIIVDHSDMHENLRGQGIGRMLAQHVVEDARSKDTAIIPLCPFFKALALRHEDWQDVVEL